jgi:hypothetical protein
MGSQLCDRDRINNVQEEFSLKEFGNCKIKAARQEGIKR